VVFFYDFANRFVKLKWQAASHKLMPKRPGAFFYNTASLILSKSLKNRVFKNYNHYYSLCIVMMNFEAQNQPAEDLCVH